MMFLKKLDVIDMVNAVMSEVLCFPIIYFFTELAPMHVTVCLSVCPPPPPRWQAVTKCQSPNLRPHNLNIFNYDFIFNTGKILHAIVSFINTYTVCPLTPFCYGWICRKY